MKIITRILVIALITFCFTIGASAATFVVNTTNDTADTTPGDGTCSDGANCSLRAAISEANALAGDDVITLPAGTYTQTLVSANDNANAGGDWDITANLTINGAGSGTTIVQANATVGVAIERVFNIRAGATVTLAGMTIRHGRFTGTMTADTRGAGIENLGTLTLNDSLVTLNQTNSTNGNSIASGISNSTATLTLNNTTVSFNINNRVSGGSAFGGGIASLGTSTITINNSSISNNSAISQAGGFGFAAGFYLQDTFTVNATNSHFDNNTGTGPSGSNGDGVRALSNIGAAVFNATGCTFNNNVGTPGGTSLHQGVGLQLFTATAATSTLTSNIINSTISGNTGNSAGIGVNATVNGGNMSLNFTGSTISGNIGSGTAANGGGILLSNAGSTFGASSTGTVNFTNSTISGNTVSANGGGIAFEQPVAAGVVTLNLNFVTLSNNSANTDATGTEAGGGIVRLSGVLNLKNSIVANNTIGGTGTGPDISGAVNSQDFNHIEDTSAAVISGSTANNVTGSDPNIGALGSNGGPTQTHLPNIGSPVINTIPNGVNDCGTTVTIDQRILPRPAGGSCDKGSTERVVAAPAQNYIDMNGDGKTDYSVVRNTGGGPGGQITWFTEYTGGTTTQIDAWGIASDFFVPGNYDADNKTDVAIWRPASQGYYILQSATGTVRAEFFGLSGDDPRVVGDYNGDGLDDIAVYRAGASAGAPSFWYWRQSAGGPVFAVQWGQNGDFPSPGDYDGDGKADFVVQRNAGGGQARFWRLFATGSSDSLVFGTPTDVIVPGDYDADGKTDIATIRGTGGQILWWIHPSGGGADTAQLWGNSATDFPTQGDYDGDGKTDIAIWRPNADPTQNFFYVLGSTAGFFSAEWGQNGDYPVANYNAH
jgi:CSLREA domain-containing protein